MLLFSTDTNRFCAGEEIRLPSVDAPTAIVINNLSFTDFVSLVCEAERRALAHPSNALERTYGRMHQDTPTGGVNSAVLPVGKILTFLLVAESLR